MNENVLHLKGKKKGKKSIILAGIHGDEKCGVLALEKISYELEIESGELYLGYGNPRAIKKNKRYIESNLNRLFKPIQDISDRDKKTYEYDRAQYLKQYLDQADCLLDIHASYTPGSHPFVICEKNAQDIVKYLPVDLVVTGFDQVQPGGTDYYMNQNGKSGMCIECGYLGDNESTKTAIEAVNNFLVARQHIPGEIKIHQQRYIHIYDMYINKTNDFKLIRNFQDFEKLSPNEIIGHDGQDEIKTDRECVILFARNCQQKGEEAFLLGEYTKNLV